MENETHGGCLEHGPKVAKFLDKLVPSSMGGVSRLPFPFVFIWTFILKEIENCGTRNCELSPHAPFLSLLISFLFLFANLRAGNVKEIEKIKGSREKCIGQVFWEGKRNRNSKI